MPAVEACGLLLCGRMTSTQAVEKVLALTWDTTDAAPASEQAKRSALV